MFAKTYIYNKTIFRNKMIGAVTCSVLSNDVPALSMQAPGIGQIELGLKSGINDIMKYGGKFSE
ncbi:LOW QUALITY PROTEIN: hypothetical protein V1477_017946 [Vespula maculifrons]|uniref:Uncharacterized protein n=1 Tax=Vespula maculifrons TaxID=7453 RepID=A0ABD2AZT4_VESMC